MKTAEQIKANKIWWEHFKRDEDYKFPPQLQPQMATPYIPPKNPYGPGWIVNALQNNNAMTKNNAVPQINSSSTRKNKRPLGNPFGPFSFPPRLNNAMPNAKSVLRNMQQPKNLTLFSFLQNMFQHCNRNKDIKLGNGIKVYISPYFANFHGTQIEGTANISISFLNAINCVVASTATGKWSLPSFASTFTSSLYGLYEERYGIDNIHFLMYGSVNKEEEYELEKDEDPEKISGLFRFPPVFLGYSGDRTFALKDHFSIVDMNAEEIEVNGGDMPCLYSTLIETIQKDIEKGEHICGGIYRRLKFGELYRDTHGQLSVTLPYILVVHCKNKDYGRKRTRYGNTARNSQGLSYPFAIGSVRAYNSQGHSVIPQRASNSLNSYEKREVRRAFGHFGISPSQASTEEYSGQSKNADIEGSVTEPYAVPFQKKTDIEESATEPYNVEHKRVKHRGGKNIKKKYTKKRNIKIRKSLKSPK